MNMVGFDLGKRKSYVVIEDDTGQVVVDREVKTRREDLSALFRAREKCTVLLEASTSSEWVARFIEEMGHSVIVADPNFGPMYAQRDKRLKTDRRDAFALLSALRLGAYREAVRRSEDELLVKVQLLSRTSLVRSRTKTVNLVRTTMQRFGYVDVETNCAKTYADSLRRNCPMPRLLELIEPSLSTIDEANRQLERIDEMLEREAEKSPIAMKLTAVPGVGKITALAFVYALSDVKRFDNADKVAAYLGLVPSVKASGETEIHGGITKRGDTVARTLLHTAALQIMTSSDPLVADLRRWALDLSRRRGGKKKGGDAIARSALARRLARIMFAMWRDGTDFKREMTADQRNEITPEAEAAE